MFLVCQLAGISAAQDSTQAKKEQILRQVSWEVASDSEVEVAVVAMGLSKIIPVKEGFSLVWVNEGYTATDYGPYNRLFLVYHSDAEMPHYEATFFIGNVGSVASVEMRDDDTIRIETALHGKLIRRHRLVSDQVQMTVDLSELNAAIESPPEEEGNLNASVKVTVSEIPK